MPIGKKKKQQLPPAYDNEFNDVIEEGQPTSSGAPPLPPDRLPRTAETKPHSVFDGNAQVQGHAAADSIAISTSDVDRFHTFQDQPPPQGIPASNFAGAGPGRGAGRLWKTTDYFARTANSHQAEIPPNQASMAARQLEKAADDEEKRRRAIQTKLTRQSARIRKRVDIAVVLAIALMVFNPLFSTVAIVLASTACYVT